MFVILTGDRSAGKSTMCKELASRLREDGLNIGGVMTETTGYDDDRTLVVHDLGDNTSTLLARTNWDIQGPRHGAFTFSREGLYLGIKAIGKGMKSDLLIIDEIGPLELNNGGFFPVLHVIRKSNQCVLVIRPVILEQVIAKLGLEESFQVVEVKTENRDQILESLHQSILTDYLKDLDN